MRTLIMSSWVGSFGVFLLGGIYYILGGNLFLVYGGLLVMCLIIGIFFIFLQVETIRRTSSFIDYYDFAVFALLTFLILVGFLPQPALGIQAFTILCVFIWLEYLIHKNFLKHKHTWESRHVEYSGDDEGWDVFCKVCQNTLKTGLTEEEAKKLTQRLNQPAVKLKEAR